MTSSFFPDLVVNGEHIPRPAVAAEAQNHAAPKGKPGIAWRKATRAMVVKTLLLQEARARGIPAAPRELGPEKFETEEEALIRGLLEIVVTPRPPTDDEVRAEWQKDPERFRAPPLWEASHILCSWDRTADAGRRRAEERAKALVERLSLRPGDFSMLATRESDCDSRTSGGVLGQIGPGDTAPEFEAALRALSEGQILRDPVLTRHGYHIIRLDACAPGRVLPFDAVREKVALAMEKAAWASAARDFVSSLIDSAEIHGADLSRA